MDVCIFVIGFDSIEKFILLCYVSKSISIFESIAPTRNRVSQAILHDDNHDREEKNS